MRAVREIPGVQKGKFCLAGGRYFPPGNLMRRGIPMLNNFQDRMQGTGCFDGLQNGN